MLTVGLSEEFIFNTGDNCRFVCRCVLENGRTSNLTQTGTCITIVFGFVGAYLTEVQQSLPIMPSSSKKAHKSSNSLRKSTGSLAASLGGSGYERPQMSASTARHFSERYFYICIAKQFFLLKTSSELYKVVFLGKRSCKIKELMHIQKLCYEHSI